MFQLLAETQTARRLRRRTHRRTRRDGGDLPRQRRNADPDPDLRDTESVPLGDAIETFFDREVRPHVPIACMEKARVDPKDGDTGFVGYEINFNRYFYRYTPPRPLEEIEADTRVIEKDILRMLVEVTGGV